MNPELNTEEVRQSTKRALFYVAAPALAAAFASSYVLYVLSDWSSWGGLSDNVLPFTWGEWIISIVVAVVVLVVTSGVLIALTAGVAKLKSE